MGSSSSDSDDEDEDESLLLSSRNSKTLGACFSDSAGLVGDDVEAACGFTGSLDAVSCSGESVLSIFFKTSTGPACVLIVETVDEVLFLPSFLDFRRRL